MTTIASASSSFPACNSSTSPALTKCSRAGRRVEVHLVRKEPRERARFDRADADGATTTFAECPRLDVVCVPGGVGVNALIGDEETLAFCARSAAEARFVTSVCTGALVLGAAGLLEASARRRTGPRSTCSPAFGAIPVAGARRARRQVSSPAAASPRGIDFALTPARRARRAATSPRRPIRIRICARAAVRRRIAENGAAGDRRPRSRRRRRLRATREVASASWAHGRIG